MVSEGGDGTKAQSRPGRPRSLSAGSQIIGRKNGIEVQKEIVQHAPAALTIIMGMERIGINLPPVSAAPEK